MTRVIRPSRARWQPERNQSVNSEVGEIPESSMEVVKVYAPAKRQAGVKIKAESPEESVAQAMKLIADAKVL